MIRRMPQRIPGQGSGVLRDAAQGDIRQAVALERGSAPIGRDNRLSGCPDGAPEIHVVHVLTGDLVGRAVEPFEELYSIRGKYRREPRDANVPAVGDQVREPLAWGLGF